MKIMIGCCGLDCEKCDAYLATIRNDDALREKTAKRWSEMNHTPIKPEWLNCEGCRADGAKTFFCSNQCEIRKCALGKGFATCGECAEMEGCETVGSIRDHNAEAARNLRAGKAFEILSGALDEAIYDAQNEKDALKRHKMSISIPPIDDYSPDEIKKIRRSVGVPQSLFAKYFGVSTKTVEAWETGRNKPSGPSSRLLGLLKAKKLALTES